MMRRVIAGAVAVSLAGCGLTMTTGPDPRRPPDQRPVCTETMDAPMRDGIGAVLGFVAIVVGGLVLESDSANQDFGASLLIGGAVVMAASYASGGIGYFRVKKCKRAIAEFDRTQAPP